MNTALLDLPSGHWEVRSQLIEEPGKPPDHSVILFHRSGCTASIMRASHLGEVDVGRVPQGELRAFARLAVYEREEQIDGTVWTFDTVKPPSYLMMGLLSGYDPPSRVTVRSEAGEVSVGELPPGRFLADTTYEDLAVLVRPTPGAVSRQVDPGAVPPTVAVAGWG